MSPADRVDAWVTQIIGSGDVATWLAGGAGPWLLALLAPAATLLAIASALFDRASHIRVRHWAEHAGERLRALYDHRRRFEAFRFLLSVISRLMPAVLLFLATTVFVAREVRGALWLAAAIALALAWFNEWLARFVVRLHAEAGLRMATPLYSLASWLLYPLVLVLAPLVIGYDEGRAHASEDEEDDASDDEIDAYIDVGRREGILEPDEEDLVRSVVDFGDTQVRSVMTPRVEINSAPVDAEPEELAARFFESKNSRLPLYRDNIDHVVGILHIRDLFESMYSPGETNPLEHCQQPHYVPESKDLPELLAELQERHQQMAIVVDEYGGVAGLVTVEDLVEEIVGDIRDEHEPQAEAEQVGEGRWRLAGRSQLEDLEEMLELDLNADELPYETLSGWICGELGHVPRVGERLELLGLELQIEEADERRVILVTVTKSPDPVAAVEETVSVRA